MALSNGTLAGSAAAKYCCLQMGGQRDATSGYNQAAPLYIDFKDAEILSRLQRRASKVFKF
jgi:hypothetical protein